MAHETNEPRYMSSCGCYMEVDKDATYCPLCFDGITPELEVEV